MANNTSATESQLVFFSHSRTHRFQRNRRLLDLLALQLLTPCARPDIAGMGLSLARSQVAPAPGRARPSPPSRGRPRIEWAPRTFENDQSILLTGKRGGRGEERGEREVIALNGERRERMIDDQPDTGFPSQFKAMFTMQYLKSATKSTTNAISPPFCQSCRSDPVGSNFAPRPSLPRSAVHPSFLLSSLAKTTHTQSERTALRA